MIVMLSLTSLYSLISHSQKVSDFHEDIYICAKQASQYVIGTQYVTVDNEYKYIDYDGKEMMLELDNHRLVKKEGFEILIHDIDDLSFFIRDESIYMTIIRDDKEYTFLLTYAKEVKEVDENEGIE